LPRRNLRRSGRRQAGADQGGDNARHAQIRDALRGQQRGNPQRQIAEGVSAAYRGPQTRSRVFLSNGWGKRRLFVVDMRESSQIAEIAERFFFGLDAKVEFVPVMSADDLQKDLSGVPGTIQRYG
jgi:hypothetical protein